MTAYLQSPILMAIAVAIAKSCGSAAPADWAGIALPLRVLPMAVSMQLIAVRIRTVRLAICAGSMEVKRV